ncbi:nitroreductase [Nocardia thailandica]
MSDRSAVLAELLTARWSCRAFESREVPRSQIERLLALAQRSASWCNTQPWQVLVTSGEGTERFRTALADYAAGGGGDLGDEFEFAEPTGYRGVYRDRRRVAGWQLYEAVGVAKGDRAASARQAAENFRLFGAPHVAVVTTDADLGVYGAIDCGLYIGTFLLAATSLGIATVPQAALASRSVFIRKYFELPEDRKIVAGISFGYADADHPANSYRTARAPLDEVVTWRDS